LSSSSDKSIIIVDDEIELADLFKEFLKKEGFNAIRSKGHTIGPNFNLDDVVELGVAIKPTVDTLLEIAREQEEAARREAAAKRELEFQDAVLKYGPKE